MATKADRSSSTKPRTPRRSRAAKAATTPTVPPVPPVAPEAPAVVTEPVRPSLLSTIDLNKEFGIDGSVTRRDTFKYNKVLGGSYVIRHAIFLKLAMASKDEIMGLTINQRKAAFSLVKGERQRYYGEATRKIDGNGAKAGDPLPKLSFETPIAAVSYGNAVRTAGENLRLAVFGPKVAAAVPEPVAQAS